MPRTLGVKPDIPPSSCKCKLQVTQILPQILRYVTFWKKIFMTYIGCKEHNLVTITYNVETNPTSNVHT
jgi:hypothetical protein